jgi:hypothetical protein
LPTRSSSDTESLISPVGENRLAGSSSSPRIMGQMLGKLSASQKPAIPMAIAPLAGCCGRTTTVSSAESGTILFGVKLASPASEADY